MGDDHNVEHNGKKWPLSALASMLTQSKWGSAGPQYFKYSGEWLIDIRKRGGSLIGGGCVAKIGKNDPCPCGSGKKYKHCCLIKKSMSVSDLIRVAMKDAGYKEELADVLCNLNSYMQHKQWWGACHASCSALYVAVSELGYSPQLCIGEMMGQGLYFDHSWIEIDNKILDVAISMTLLGGMPVTDPIIFGKNIRTGKEPSIKYGVPGRGIEGETLIVMSMPFSDYMDNFPDEKNGLWGVVQKLLDRKIDIFALREKYKNVKRVIVRNED